MSGLTLVDAANVLAAQPFSRLLGTRMVRFDDSGASLELDLRDDLRQQFGFAHGGVIAYLVDNVLTFAGGAVLGPKVLTAGYTIDLLAPASGPLLLAEGSVVGRSGRRAVCRAEIFNVADGEKLLCATAQGSIALAGSKAERS
ncbi:PaaI family thioesterase [Luteipulveratus mongoliensis]|uniref:Thioesterase n=1 Tax=Luteipulveratus mongoliensis TaxID=571913 RepID=A0A0K1JEY2_9MICO|nr:PaaI family thioesterase [Luteipulveratus mongoliensis]AKU15259.1 thioesterase [Luteipulveratus mongoliensis]